jgi:peptidoglycan/LPS O-acetylase OafA/YrhL
VEGSFRFLLALSVLAFHSGLPVLGPFAVYVFYLLSGYSIYAALDKYQSQNSDYFNFWKKRFRKLIPFYLFVGFSVISLLYLVSITVPDQLNSLTSQSDIFLEKNIGSILNNLVPTIDFSGNNFQLNPSVFYVPPWWSVVMEIGFYITLFIIVIIQKKFSYVLEFITVGFLILHIVLVFRCQQDLGALNSLVYFNWFGTFIFFLIGALVRKYRNRNYQSFKIKCVSQIIAVTILFLFSTLVMDPTQIIQGYPVYGYFIVVYFLIILVAFFLLSLSFNPENSLLDNRFANLSYKIYVSQSIAFPGIILFETNFVKVSSFNRFLLVTLISICIALIPDLFLRLIKSINVMQARFFSR